MVYATVFLHYPFTMADGEERENRGKDDGRKTSLVGTLKYQLQNLRAVLLARQ